MKAVNYIFIISLVSILIIKPQNSFSQGVSISTDGSAPAAGVGLDVQFGGIKLPSFTTAEMNAIATPPAGLLIYNSTTGELNLNKTAGANAFAEIGNVNNYWNVLGNANTNSTTNFFGTTDSVDLSIRTNNTIKATFTTTGRLGIGTVAPAATLQVFNNNSSTTNITNFSSSITNNASTVDTVIVIQARLGNAGAINNASLVKVGDLDPPGTIGTVKGLDIGLLSGGSITNSYAIYSSDINAITYLNGNLGIGTSSPAARLHIVADPGEPIMKFDDGGGAGNKGKIPYASATGKIYLGSPANIKYPVTTTAGPTYNVVATDYIINSTAGAGTTTINLPSATNNIGRMLIITIANAGSSNANIVANGADLIAGAPNLVLTLGQKTTTLVCVDASNWIVVSLY